MPLTLTRKKTVVTEVSERVAVATSAAIADYRGLTVPQLTLLRSEARKKGVYLRVIKNTLACQAFKGTPLACLTEAMTGPLVVAFSTEDPGSLARLLRDFARIHEKLKVQAFALGGVMYAASQIESICNLPTQQEALSKLVFVMQAPIAKFVRTLAEPVAKCVRTFALVGDKKTSEVSAAL